MTINLLHLKLASLVVHCEEMLSPGGHDFDRHAIQGLIADPEVRAFVATFDPVLLPVKRKAP
jgi:hypothetical protein